MKRTMIVLLLLLAAGAASAQDSGFRDPQGNMLPATESARTVDGFAAMVMITSDRDWEAKWATPYSEAPAFTSADSVATGGELALLFFFHNPQRGAGDAVEIRCDLKMTRPDGSVSLERKDIPCFQGVVAADRNGVHLSNANLKFVAEASDPLGTWTVQAVLRDVVRGVEVPLQASFEHVSP